MFPVKSEHPLNLAWGYLAQSFTDNVKEPDFIQFIIHLKNKAAQNS